jgi:hypothetical protein
MNKALAGAVRVLNGFFAVLFVIVGAAVGGLSSRFSPVGLFLGIVSGVVVATIACGLLAFFIDMRTELIRIREILERQRPAT